MALENSPKIEKSAGELLILFKPDNFSDPKIGYHSVEGAEWGLLESAVGKFFGDARILEARQLNGAEVNSNNYQIFLEYNGEKRKILLRRFKTLRDADLINFYLGLINHLGSRGVPISRIIPSLENQLSAAQGDSQYAAFDFINGEHFAPTEAGFISLASAIAGMHAGFNVLDEAALNRVEQLSSSTSYYFNKYRQYSAADFEAIRERIHQKSEKSEMDLAVLAKLPIFLNTVDEVRSREEAMVKLKTGVIHSDLHPHNILMNGDKVGAIVDFDSVRISQQARDAAFAIYRFGRQFFVTDSSRAQERAPELVKLFINSYSAIKKLSAEEIELLPILVKDEFLKKILFVLNGVYTESNFAWAKDLGKFLMAIDEINIFWPKK